MILNQGDIYWLKLEELEGYPHPHVVIQEDIINHSRIQTVVVCSLTTNIKRVNIPGKVLLAAGEANLLRQSIVVVSHVSTVEKSQLGEYIGSLTKVRVDQILAGMRFIQRLTEHHA